MPPSANNPEVPAKPHILRVECADRPGLVHEITGILFRGGVNVAGNQEFVDRASQRFFMRTEFDGATDARSLEAQVKALLPSEARVELSSPDPKRVVVLASKEHHCLADLLVRHAYGELNAEVVAVLANHDTLAPLAQRFDMPFHWVRSDSESREAHERELIKLLDQYQPEYLVLAKYMRVLSPQFVARYPARIVNIHHSFLPAFAGAKPYHQAYERGVKVIGATAHLVTDDLDAGPIIVQQVVPVDHTHTVQDLVRSGRDVEQMVLARALRLVFEDRVFLCGNRTVILD